MREGQAFFPRSRSRLFPIDELNRARRASDRDAFEREALGVAVKVNLVTWPDRDSVGIDWQLHVRIGLEPFGVALPVVELVPQLGVFLFERPELRDVGRS